MKRHLKYTRATLLCLGLVAFSTLCLVMALDLFGQSPQSNQMAALPQIVLSSVTPASALPGETVTITGSGFGDVQGSSTVTFGTVPASVMAWSNYAITVRVPTLGPGAVSVSVQVGGIFSSPAHLSVRTGAVPAISISRLAGPFSWSSTGPLVHAIPNSTHPILAVKDPTVVFFNNRWHVYATTSNGSAWSMMYINFPTWQQAAAAQPYYMDATPGFTGYHAAPEVFFFRPQNKWYLIFQSPQPQFSTTSDLSKPNTWTVPRNFFATQPTNVPNWIDFWVICDAANCYLFFTGDDGNFWRSQTSIQNFPSGFNTPVLVMKASNRFDLFEASNTYFVKGLNQYLTLVEGLDGSGRRYFRSFTANSLSGSWTPVSQANTGAQPFAGFNNVRFDSGVNAWTTDFSHGEMLRAGFDETLTIDPNNLQYLYQGTSSHPSSYIQIPWQLGLLH